MVISSSLVLQFFIIIILVLMNAFFAASEIAIISLNDNKIKKMAEEGNKKAILLINLIREPSRFLATIQVGITLAGLLASAFASETFADWLTEFAVASGVPLARPLIKLLSVVIITLLLSYTTLVFGELVPKRIAMQKYEEVSMLSIGPLSFLSKIAAPFVRLLTFSTNFIIKHFGMDPAVHEEKITEEEIRMMVDVGQERGAIRGTEREMIDNIFEFDNTMISEIMTHRTEIIGIELNTHFDEVINTVVNEKYSRIPVYEDTIDNIVGILHAKDLIQYTMKKPGEGFRLMNIMRKPYFVPSSKKSDELFKELKQSKNHMAVVIDEYGGTAGIITVEDLLEEIVGNILDEYDEEEKEIEKIDENTFMIEGGTSLDHVQDYLDVKLPLEEYDTLSGFVTGQLGRIPAEEEKPEVEFNGVLFKVEEVEEKRIAKVKVCRA